MLIKCPECGREVSDKATACPHCGCPIAGALAPKLVEPEPHQDAKLVVDPLPVAAVQSAEPAQASEPLGTGLERTDERLVSLNTPATNLDSTAPMHGTPEGHAEVMAVGARHSVRDKLVPCPNCAYPVPPDRQYCPSCSTLVEDDAPADVAVATKDAPEVSNSRLSKRGWLDPATIFGYVGGFIVWKFFGFTMFIPLALVFIAYLLGSRVVRPDAKPMLPAVSVLAGHSLWMVVGLVALGLQGSEVPWLNLLDVAALLGGAVWLLWRPHLVPALLLTAYHLVAFAMNERSMGATYDWSTAMLPGFIMHSLLRGAAVVAMFWGLSAVGAARHAKDVPIELPATGEVCSKADRQEA